MRSSLSALALTLSLTAVAHADDPGAPSIYAITNARIVVSPGKVITKGTIVLRNGLIESVGEKVTPPSDATVIDGTGQTLYPGLINAYTRLGQPTELSPAERGDAYPVPAVRAELSASAILKPDNDATKLYRQLGFGAALSAPSLGLFSGSSAVVTLGEADSVSSLVLKGDVFQHTNFGGGGFGSYPGSLMGQIAVLRQVISDARFAARQSDSYEKNPAGKARPTVSRALSALRGVTEKKQQLVVRASSVREIERALRLADELGVEAVLEGGAEAYAVAQKLKQSGATLLLSADLPAAPTVKPGEESDETLQSLRRRALVPTTAAALAKLGVPFALTTATPGDFYKNLRKLIAAGLTEDQALTAVTLSPAKILGVDRQLGTLETGKIANLVAVTGESLFSSKSKIARVFVDGKPVTLPTAAAATASAKPASAPAISSDDLKKQLPPGVTPEMALQFLKANPDQAKPFLPAGVTVEQAIAALEGKPQAAETAKKPETDEEAKAPPTVEAGPIPALPKPISASFVIRHATVWTSAAAGILNDTDVYVKDGKIAAIGKDLKVGGDTVEIDGRGKHVTPGMIDCHSHTAISGGVNEGSNSVTAECRIQDVINPDDTAIYWQLAGGTTTANLLHGSANAIGGQNAVVKWRWGSDADAMLFKNAPQGIKFALGENPTRSNSGFSRDGAPRYPISRMGVERVIRAKFLEARDYQANIKAGKPVRRDFQLDAIVEILEGKRLVHSHCYRSDEILMLVRLAEEFGFKIATFQHVLEGYKVADELAAHGVGGSTFADWWGYKIEAYDAIPWNGALMTERGMTVSFNSDSSELARRMNFEAAKAVRWGNMSPAEALKFVTINPAKQLHIDQYVGSIETGKDGDIVIWNGDPLSVYTSAEKTFVDGKLYFDRAADLENRKAITAEKKRLAAALSPAPTAPKAAVAAAVSTGSVTSPPLQAKPTEAPTGAITAIVGGTVHPVSGPAIEDGLVLMQGTKITAIGKAGTVRLSADVKIVDAKGLHVWPGLFDANNTVGVNEIGSRRETQDYREMNTFQPELFLSHVVNPDAETVRVARAEGILSSLLLPTGGVFSGMGALINLDGWTWEQMGVKPAAGLVLEFPGSSVRFSFDSDHCGDDAENYDQHLDEEMRAGIAQPPAGGRRGRPGAAGAGPAASPENAQLEALRPLNEFLDQARRYRTARLAEKTGGARVDRDPKFEAMLPVLDKTVPLFVRVDAKRDIENAVAWAKKEGFKIVLFGATEADKCAELLVREQIAVVLPPVLAMPRTQDAAYDDFYSLPKRLADAGVTFCLSSGGDNEKVRNLMHSAGMAAAFGLDKDTAVKAITLAPAQILGVADRLGSLEVGKDATLLLTTGDVLELSSQVKAAYVNGEKVDLSSRQSNLYNRWRARPRAQKAAK